MNCAIVNDLIPLYIDKCCSDESAKMIEEHIKSCNNCKRLFENMKSPCRMAPVSEAPKALNKLSDWKASVLQSVLLFLSFALITAGVALEAGTPSGFANGFWAINLVVPATGFLLSLANWYFIRVYKTKQFFSNSSLLATIGITLCGYIWAGFHYEVDLLDLFTVRDLAEIFEILHSLLLVYGIGILLTAIFCTLSKLLSNQYAKMLGKE